MRPDGREHKARHIKLEDDVLTLNEDGAVTDVVITDVTLVGRRSWRLRDAEGSEWVLKAGGGCGCGN